MHESGMIRGLVEKIKTIVDQEGGGHVTGVKVWLGALSQISASHFKDHFDQETTGTIAEGAQLEVEKSDDVYDPNAQYILLKSVDVNE